MSNFSTAIKLNVPGGGLAEFIYTPHKDHEPMLTAELRGDEKTLPMPDEVNLGDGWWFISY